MQYTEGVVNKMRNLINIKQYKEMEQVKIPEQKTAPMEIIMWTLTGTIVYAERLHEIKCGINAEQQNVEWICK